MAAGHRWVVDLDLEKFFDRVNHDVLLARLRRRVKDKCLLGLIHRYLVAGMMEGGLVSPRTEGTPQGSPLSPLLSNVMLDDLDKELERRGHRFARYADDCNVYVRSRRAGQRVMVSLERFLQEQLRLKVNRAKSAVARPWERKFLGYSVTNHHQVRLKVAAESVKRFKAKLRQMFHKGRGRSLRTVVKDSGPGHPGLDGLPTDWRKSKGCSRIWTSGFGGNCAGSSGVSGNAGGPGSANCAVGVSSESVRPHRP